MYIESLSIACLGKLSTWGVLINLFCLYCMIAGGFILTSIFRLKFGVDFRWSGFQFELF